MTATRLSLYNGALRLLGQTKLANLNEDVENRYYLDDVWDDGALNYCLEQGYWNFAIRTQERSYSPDIEPDFGFQYAFDKPTDWLRTAGIASDGYFRNPLSDLEYKDEAGYWFSDLQNIFVRYVSNDAEYGLDLSKWPQTFTDYVEAELALRICPRIEQAQSRLAEVKETRRKKLIDARSKDAMNEGAAFAPSGSWGRARRGGSSRYIGSRG